MYSTFVSVNSEVISFVYIKYVSLIQNKAINARILEERTSAIHSLVQLDS